MPCLRARGIVIAIDERGTIVLIERNVMAALASFTRPPHEKKEAGGILIGSYRGPHIDVIACTLPMPSDRRCAFTFDRKDKGHDVAAKTYWKESGGRLTFVGEWHTHPEDYPTPSPIDRRTWAKVVQSAPTDPKVFLIAGRRSIWIGLGMKHVFVELRVLES
jgi:integrative and conjugative element protein (TIGR02256 family)